MLHLQQQHTDSHITATHDDSNYTVHKQKHYGTAQQEAMSSTPGHWSSRYQVVTT